MDVLGEADRKPLRETLVRHGVAGGRLRFNLARSKAREAVGGKWPIS
jgi:hypothetical protein